MLTYPLQPAPEPGETREVAPGVHWLRMPLPFGLNHINLWVLQDDDGWTLVDTGIHTSQSASTWQSVICGLMAPRPAGRVICTHMHPDHVGMAGWLAQQFDCRLWMTRLEYMTCRVLVGDTDKEAPAEALRFYSGLGWSSQALDHYKSRFGSFGKMISPLPQSYRRVEDGEQIGIGGRLWHAVVGRGHSPEHLCLYCPELKLLISGDQVLPRISSNVSVFPTEPDADPLSEWLESLASIKSQIADDVLVLPAHNEPFHGLHSRIDDLIATHHRRLESLYTALSAPRGVMDTLSVLFRRELTGDQLLMGTGEALAHLNWLIRRNRVRREGDANGVARFQAI